MISDAVTIDRISRIIGYKLTTGNFATVSPNLPQRIAVLAEANDANQGTLLTTPQQITSAQQAGQLFGYGSPAYLIARILFPKQGSGVGSIPVWYYPQAVAGGALPKIMEVTASGVATDNGVHYVNVAGREGMDGFTYAINIAVGDTNNQITAKIANAINGILGSPVVAVQDSDYESVLTTKWSGLTANDVTVTVDTGLNALGLTYSTVTTQAGSGTPSVQAALNQFGNDWTTIVINGYGLEPGTMTTLEAFNGIPDPVNPTGRFVGIIMKPFIALSGTTLDDPSSITDARLNQVTIAACPAPNSAGLQFEAAANYAVLFAIISQTSPHLDVSGSALPDMPVPTALGTMGVYANRDLIVKKGCSTVDLISGQYIIQDFVTTYHKVGDNPPQFRYCRNIMLDLNIRYSYYLLEQINVVDHAIAADTDIVSVDDVIKPKQWKQLLNAFADDLAKRALIVDAPFMQNSLQVGLSITNPDRLETFFKYKRSGFVRISSTTAQAGFNFGTLN